MSEASKIGLNETTFGILPPPFAAALMVNTIGYRQAERALSLGTMFKPEEAYNIGLVGKIYIVILYTSYIHINVSRYIHELYRLFYICAYVPVCLYVCI